MSETLDRLRTKVQAVLTANLQVGLDREGAFTVAYESAQGWVSVWETDDGRSIVKVEAPLLFGVKPTAELFEYVASHSNDLIFGHLSCSMGDEGVMILLTYQLLGDYLDDGELLNAVYAVVGSGNQLDDELQGMFGGRRWID